MRDEAILDAQKMLKILKECNEKISKKEAKIFKLTKENQTLQEKLSIDHAELTPRPSFHKVCFLF